MDSVLMEQSAVQNVPQQKRGISGSTIKIIAIVAMLIDHIGAVIVERILINHGMLYAISSGDTGAATQFMANDGGLFILYMVMRQLIGRIGFPIFCFLLVEGFTHTKNVKKYALRLAVFALISEIPFDLAFKGKFVDFSYQNVFFTLLIGLLTMIVFRLIEEKVQWNRFLKIVLYVPALIVGAIIAECMATDYGAIGIICIIAIYFFRKTKWQQILAGCLVFLWEFTAPLAFIPIGFYNGKRGLKMKYFFYAFYPAHLLILAVIAYFMGLI